MCESGKAYCRWINKRIGSEISYSKDDGRQQGENDAELALADKQLENVIKDIFFYCEIIGFSVLSFERICSELKQPIYVDN